MFDVWKTSFLQVERPYPQQIPLTCGIQVTDVRGCNVCFLGETIWHFSTRLSKQLATDRVSQIFKCLQNFKQCESLCSPYCFNIFDRASTSFKLTPVIESILMGEPNLKHKTVPCKFKTSFIAFAAFLCGYYKFNFVLCVL